MLRLGGKEQKQNSRSQVITQRRVAARLEAARSCERTARRNALEALRLGGPLALQCAGLSRFYARRAVSLMGGGR